ncbi:BCAM0308 family protein [Halopseudomonas sp.]|jgi:NMD protein affecting ribosome stability and mRNA decay|uniref:BCAM0308 family protein n=1 Tax=Halopseudomonas sp. TaxID=2901191 RepID=UPI0039E3227C
MDKHQQSQKDKLFKPSHGDPYLEVLPRGSAQCPQCGAVHDHGRWSWQQAVPKGAQAHVCPACRRIADDQPAGTLHLAGGFLAAHREEVLGLIHNTEAAEKAQHALERLIKVSEQEDGLQVTTTGTHLAKRLGHALSGAFKGECSYQYAEDELHLTVHWSRD